MTNQKSLDEAEFLELIRNIDELDFLEEEDFEGEDAELYQQLQAQQTLPQNYSTKVTENTEEEWTQQNDGYLHDSSGLELIKVRTERIGNPPKVSWRSGGNPNFS